MAKNVFFTPDGARTSVDHVKKLTFEAAEEGKPDPYAHEHYESDRMKVTLFTHRYISVSSHEPAAYWKPFGVEVANVVATDYEGRPLPKPEDRQAASVKAVGT